MSIIVPETKTTRASVYKQAGDARLAEAEFLRDEYPSGAIYLAGYLIECYLKWALCARNQVQYLQALPDRELAEVLTGGKGHNLEQLCGVAGYDVHFVQDPMVHRAFQVAAVWSPSIRYIRACGGLRDAVQFLAAVRILRKDIETWAHV